MSKKLIYLMSFVLVLSIGGNASADLVAHWSLDEGSGTTAVDMTGNGHDGTIGGTANWVAGQIGLALDFDGSSTYIDMDDRVLDTTFTLTMWLKPRDIPYFSDYYAILHDDAWDSGSVHVHLRNTTSLFNMDINGEPDVTSTTVLQADEWYHFAVTVDTSADRVANLYVNGVLENTGTGGSGTPYLGPLNFGAWTNNQRYYHGLMDDIRIYDHVLSEVEVLGAMTGEVWPYAWGPSPADGALHADTWVTLSWKPGGFAVSHDVYLGDNFDDVNDGTGDTFRGNQGDTYFIAGFPGFPYPDGLVPGTTYYWRIDEVNEADPNSPWKGDVWSFTVPPRTAYAPNPADGAKFIDPDGTLSWTAGFGAKLHTVYFGDNFDDVNNAAGGVPQGATTYSPGPLELEKVYYWRVDEFDAITTHKGDVWSFTTAGAGGGLKAEYYHHSGITPPNPPSLAFRTLILTRTDPQINFNWGDPGSPDPSVNVDDFSARWTGNVEAAFTETYTFYTNTDDGVMLWVDGQLLVDNWTDHSPTENRGTIDLVAGQQYSIEMWWYERGGGAVAELRWSSPRTPKQLIPQAALSLPVKALSPNPSNGATGVRMTATLSWRPGDNAASHQVYFGTDEEAVKNATTASPEYKGSKALGSESYDPGKLAWFTTYYWRVDEVNDVHPDSPWVGNLWSFTTGDFLVVDDFELYNDLDPEVPGSNRIFLTWMDGYDTPINGSQVGYTDPPFCERTIVHSGRQSMPLFYNNSGPAYYSEATLPLTFPRDWTEEGVKILTLWFYGDPANAAESMYVAVANATGPTAVMYHDNVNAAVIDEWTQWNIGLEEFSNAGVSLTNVDSIAIGFGNRNNPQVGGSGLMFIDDIRLYRPATEQ